MTTHPKRSWFTFLPVALGVLLILAALLAGSALAGSGDMSGMPGMTDEEMQGMTGEPAQATDGHAAEAAADTHGGMGGGAGDAVNWLVIGGFIALIAGSTLAARATKRHLQQRILTGELALAGVKDV